MVLAGVVANEFAINPEAERNASATNKVTQIKASMSVETGFRKMLETLIRTMYKVMYGDARSPVCQISAVIKTASTRNCSQICHVILRLSRSRKKYTGVKPTAMRKINVT